MAEEDRVGDEVRKEIRTDDIESLKELDAKVEKLKLEIRKWIKEDLKEVE